MASTTLSINPTPADSTVVLTAAGYIQANNSITVPEGTEVTYKVSKDDYATVSGTYTPTVDVTLSIVLPRPSVDINVVMENLSELLTNSVELTDKFYDIFFNPDPLEITFKHYNDNNELVEVTIPNRAMMGAPAFSGDGSPEGEVTASIGAIYIDTATRQMYVKAYASLNDSKKKGWKLIPITQYSTMPAASAGNEGAIIQYTGTTTSTYTNGYMYKCVENNGLYSWERTDVQPSVSVINDLSDVTITSPTQGQALTYDATNQIWKNTSTTATVGWGGITGTLSDQSDLQNALDDKQDILTSANAGSNVSITSSGTTPMINALTGLSASISELNVLDGITATTAELNIMDGVTATTAELNILDGVTATTTELNYCDGVISNIQTQLDSKLSEQDELIQNITPMSANAVTLVNNKGIYSKTITANTTFTFDVSGLGSLTNKAVTFELYLTMDTVYTLTFPSSVTWVATPTMTNTGKYLFVFKSMDGGSTWIGNLECNW